MCTVCVLALKTAGLDGQCGWTVQTQWKRVAREAVDSIKLSKLQKDREMLKCEESTVAWMKSREGFEVRKRRI